MDEQNEVHKVDINIHTPESKDEYILLKRRKKRMRQIEIIIWFCFAGAVYIYPIAKSTAYMNAPYHMEGFRYTFTYFVSYLFDNYYLFVLFSILIFLFPILFNLIFGLYPLESIRVKGNRKIDSPYDDSGDSSIKIENIKLDGATIDYKLICINESKAIADKIYKRSGVYLLAGSLIAFIGIGIFYSPIFANTNSIPNDLSQRILDYLPRFGALFFIEFIAFFFLRQFRVMHEEYRYYEAIKRQRQDNFNLLLLVEKYGEKTELLKLIVESHGNINVGKLGKDETTHILESQKITNQDMDIFSKFIELAKELKGR